MKRTCIPLVLALILAFSLMGCAPQNVEPDPTIPTLPSFPEEKTPLEQLTAAVEKTISAASFVLEYRISDEAAVTQLVSIDENGQYTSLLTQKGSENLTYYAGTVGYRRDADDYFQYVSETPIGVDLIFEYLARFVTNENLLSDFCARSLNAIPSNTGIIRYEVTDLTAAELNVMLFGNALSGESVSADCSIALETDSSGCLTRFEYSFGESITKSVTISRINEELTIRPPEWAASFIENPGEGYHVIHLDEMHME